MEFAPQYYLNVSGGVDTVFDTHNFHPDFDPLGTEGNTVYDLPCEFGGGGSRMEYLSGGPVQTNPIPASKS